MIKILGIGNALVDIMTILNEDSILDQINFPKGSMQLVDLNTSEQIYIKTTDLEKSISAGGSAANTINGLANLGVSTAFIGKVGNDSFGNLFENDLIKNKIEPKLLKGISPSGVAIGLISPDSERTFATYLGAAIEMIPDDMIDNLFHGFEILHIEGYLVQNQNLIRKAVQLAKAHGLKVSLDLASYNVVEENIDFLNEIIVKYVDIVFANEEEAKSLTGLSPEESLHKIAESCEIVVVKLGKNGSLIKSNDQVYKVGVIEAESVDTTGAGDLYASGFLYGLSKGYSLNKCGQIGSILSGNVIEVIGSKMNSERWEKIRKMVELV